MCVYVCACPCVCVSKTISPNAFNVELQCKPSQNKKHLFSFKERQCTNKSSKTRPSLDELYWVKTTQKNAVGGHKVFTYDRTLFSTPLYGAPMLWTHGKSFSLVHFLLDPHLACSITNTMQSRLCLFITLHKKDSTLQINIKWTVELCDRNHWTFCSLVLCYPI